MPKAKATPVAPAVSQPHPIVKEGLMLLRPLKSLVSGITVASQEDYLIADSYLARVKTARAQWALRTSPIITPAKEALAKQKESLAAAEALHHEVDDPLLELEGEIKKVMKDYKLKEIMDKRAADEETARLQREADQKRLEAEQAKTAGARKLRESIAEELEEQAQEVQAAVEPQIMGVSSSARATQKVRIQDFVAFLRGLKDYAPKAGLWQMGHPPLSLLTAKMDRKANLLPPQRDENDDELPFSPDSAAAAVEVELRKIFAVQPGVVKSWPGIEIYDDVTIANR